MGLKRITFTGLDETTRLEQLPEICENFPQFEIEWGVLFSLDNTANRYVHSEDFLKGVVYLRDFVGLKFAAHLCGKVARDFVSQPLKATPIGLTRAYQRLQLNINFERNPLESLKQLSENLKWFERQQYRIILQYNNANSGTVARLIEQSPYFDVLFDQSGGRGKELDVVRAKNEMFNLVRNGDTSQIAYAGGINPDNVLHIVTQLEQLHQGRDYGIDMESGVRDDHDFFDLNKVVHVLEKAQRATKRN